MVDDLTCPSGRNLPWLYGSGLIGFVVLSYFLALSTYQYVTKNDRISKKVVAGSVVDHAVCSFRNLIRWMPSLYGLGWLVDIGVRVRYQ